MSDLPRVGIVGTGWWAARHHLPALTARDDVAVVALCDLRRDVRTDLARKYGVPIAVDDLPAMLGAELDGVVICSPNHLHAPQAVECLRAGCHVLCEKPLAVESGASAAVVAEVARSGRDVFMAYGWHYRGIWQKARALFREPGVGSLRHGTLSMVMPDYGLFGGPDQLTDDVRPQPRTWRDIAIGGGTIHAAFTHALALLLWIVDDRATRASARIGGHPDSRHRWLSGWVELAGGATIGLEHDSLTPSADGDQLRVELFGDTGRLVADTDADRVRLSRHDERSRSLPLDAEERTYDLGGVTEAFVRRLHGHARNEVDAGIGHRAVVLTEALIRSSDQDGQPVRLPTDPLPRHAG